MGTLRAADEELLTSLRLLTAQVALPAPDWSALPKLRYRISRAMAARHKIVDDRPAPDCAMVEEALALRQRYTAHIGKWTPAAIAAQWPAYCTDSRALVSAIRGHVEAYNRLSATQAALPTSVFAPSRLHGPPSSDSGLLAHPWKFPSA